MDSEAWLRVVREEYLEDFVREGGAAVKFAVPAAETGRQEVRDGLRQAAVENGFQFAFVDAESTKIHLVDQLFFEVARQIDWDSLIRSFLARTLEEMGYALPPHGDQLRLQAIAALNDFPEPLFYAEVRRSLSARLYRDYAMAREFRLAMLRLCLSMLDPGDEPTLAEAVKQWLTGDLRLVSALKRALIFQKIARHNARHMLVSLAYWLKLCGRSGLVLGLDISRYLDATRPSERGSGFYYSTAAAMDAYEVLRQLIDASDEMENCFVGVLADPDFLNDDRRGLRSYQALYLRIADDVRDRYRPNPRSSLVRLAPAAEGAA